MLGFFFVLLLLVSCKTSKPVSGEIASPPMQVLDITVIGKENSSWKISFKESSRAYNLYSSGRRYLPLLEESKNNKTRVVITTQNDQPAMILKVEKAP